MPRQVTYRLRCTTDNVYEYVTQNKQLAAPTLCPTNAGHTINTDHTTIIDKSGRPDASLYLGAVSAQGDSYAAVRGTSIVPEEGERSAIFTATVRVLKNNQLAYLTFFVNDVIQPQTTQILMVRAGYYPVTAQLQYTFDGVEELDLRVKVNTDSLWIYNPTVIIGFKE